MDHIREITSDELRSLMKKDSSIEIIDVREDDEVAQGMIKEAKHIRLAEIPEAVQDLNKDKHYVMVCRSGGRSMKAALFMNEHGLKVTNMAGGMLEWNKDTEN